MYCAIKETEKNPLLWDPKEKVITDNKGSDKEASQKERHSKQKTQQNQELPSRKIKDI